MTSSYYEKIGKETKNIDGEIPFELPDGWTWCRLAYVLSLSSGKAIKVRQLSSDGTFPVYGGNGVNGTYSEFNVESETIIIGRVGFYCGCVYKTTSRAWVTDNALITTIKTPGIFDTDFLLSVLKYLNLGSTSVSTAQPVVSGKGILPLIVPVPPLEEQKSICAELKMLSALIENIEESLS